jgi:hypothetical protein
MSSRKTLQISIIELILDSKNDAYSVKEKERETSLPPSVARRHHPKSNNYFENVNYFRKQ